MCFIFSIYKLHVSYTELVHQKDSVRATESHGSECPLVALNHPCSSPPVGLSLSPLAWPCPRLPPAWASCLCSTLWECPSCKPIGLWWSRLEVCPCLALGLCPKGWTECSHLRTRVGGSTPLTFCMSKLPLALAVSPARRNASLLWGLKALEHLWNV